MREENPGIPVLALDGGNFLGQPGIGGDLRSRLLLDAGAGSGYDVINVGPREAERWSDIPGLAGGRTLPWVSANVGLPEAALAAAPAPPAVRRFTFPKLKVAVVGLSEPDAPINGVTFRPSLAALQEQLAPLTDPEERIVVIGRLPVTRAAVLSGANPRILAILSGYGVMESESPMQFGSAVVAFPGEQGKSLIDLRISLKGGKPAVLSYHLVPLDKSVPSLPDWQKKLDETMKAVREVEFDFAEPSAETEGDTAPESTNGTGAPAQPAHPPEPPPGEDKPPAPTSGSATGAARAPGGPHRGAESVGTPGEPVFYHEVSASSWIATPPAVPSRSIAGAGEASSHNLRATMSAIAVASSGSPAEASSPAPGTVPPPTGPPGSAAASAKGGAGPMSAPAPPARPATTPVRKLPVPAGGQIHPSVAEALTKSRPGEFVEALVELAEQADLDALMASYDALSLGKAERRARTLAALSDVAGRRGPLEAWLDEKLQEGAVDLWRGFTIVNRLYVLGTPEVLRALAGREDVAALLPVRYDATSPGFPEDEHDHPREGGSSEPVSTASWALDAMGVRKAWAGGWTGRGVVVGSLDTGVAAEHIALKGNHRAERGWIDPLSGRKEPWDDHGHGTEAMSCAVGRGRSPEILGVAPGAQWIAARTNPLNRFNAHGLSAGADWMLREGQPDVLLCAWGHGPGRCETTDVPLLKALRLAEILVVLPAGNSGPRPGTGESPAALPPLFANDLPPLSVAATEPSGGVFDRSSRGPSPCAGATKFPWIAAPGTGLRVASYAATTSFASGAGTSLSAGYVAGAAALLLQRCPTLTVRDLQQALADSAHDISPPGFDPASGFGLIDIPATLQRLHCTADTAAR